MKRVKYKTSVKDPGTPGVLKMVGSSSDLIGCNRTLLLRVKKSELFCHCPISRRGVASGTSRKLEIWEIDEENETGFYEISPQ